MLVSRNLFPSQKPLEKKKFEGYIIQPPLEEIEKCKKEAATWDELVNDGGQTCCGGGRTYSERQPTNTPNLQRWTNATSSTAACDEGGLRA